MSRWNCLSAYLRTRMGSEGCRLALAGLGALTLVFSAYVAVARADEQSCDGEDLCPNGYFCCDECGCGNGGVCRKTGELAEE